MNFISDRLKYKSDDYVYVIHYNYVYQGQEPVYQITGIYQDNIDNNIFGDIAEYLPELFFNMRKAIESKLLAEVPRPCCGK